MQLLKKHQDLMAQLQKEQEKCWLSNDKVAKLDGTTALQKAFVKHYEVTQKKILADIEKMDNECDKKVMKHAKNYGKFQTTLMDEIACREKLEKLSIGLEADVFDKMAAAISRMMHETGQTITVEEVQRLARNVLEMTSRHYSSKAPTKLPCGQDKITGSSLIGSKLSKLGKNEKTAVRLSRWKRTETTKT